MGGETPELPEILENFGRHLSFERGLAQNTRLAYMRDVRDFARYSQAAFAAPDKADAPFIDKYLWQLKSARRLGARSIFRKLESLKAFFRFLQLENKISDNPAAGFKSPHLPERIPHWLNPAEIKQLLSYPAETFPAVRTLAIIELFYSAGLRITELVNLRLELVNLEKGWVLVYGKGGKERMVPFTPGSCVWLSRYLEMRARIFGGKATGGELFLGRAGKKLSRVQVWKDITNIGRLSGLKRRLHPHLFRHTFASHLLRGGADLRSLQEMLGHASLSTTQIYTHIEKSDLKSIHSRFHPRGG